MRGELFASIRRTLAVVRFVDSLALDRAKFMPLPQLTEVEEKRLQAFIWAIEQYRDHPDALVRELSNRVAHGQASGEDVLNLWDRLAELGYMEPPLRRVLNGFLGDSFPRPGAICNWIARLLMSALCDQQTPTTRRRRHALENDVLEAVLLESRGRLARTARHLPLDIRESSLQTAVDVLHDEGVSPEKAWATTRMLQTGMVRQAAACRLQIGAQWCCGAMTLGGGTFTVLTEAGTVLHWHLNPALVIVLTLATGLFGGWGARRPSAERDIRR